MGIPDGAHTHGHGGGSGLGTVVLVILAVALLGPAVAAAVAELLHLLVIVLVVLAAVTGAGLVAFGAWRLRQPRPNAAPVTQRITPAPARPSPLLSEPRRAIERGGHLHLHFHGAGAEEIAALLARDTLPGPDVNRPDPPRVP
jgi:hypothetical protein